MASSDSPKAAEMPAKPIWLPANTALPTPPKTRTNVPTSSAKYLFMDASSGHRSIRPFLHCRCEYSLRALASAAGGLSRAHRLHFAVLDAVTEIDTQTDDQPDDEHFPGQQRQLDHEVEGAADAKDGDQRNQRRPERPLQVGVAPAQDPDTGTDDGKSEQRAHIHQRRQLIDGKQCGQE